MYYKLISTAVRKLNVMEALLMILWSFQNRLFFGNSWNSVIPLNDTPIILVFLHEKSFIHSEIWYNYRRALNRFCCEWLCLNLLNLISPFHVSLASEWLSTSNKPWPDFVCEKQSKNQYHPNSHLGLLSWSFVNDSKVCHPTDAWYERTTKEKTPQIVVYLIVVCQCMWYRGRDLGGILHSGTTNK